MSGVNELMEKYPDKIKELFAELRKVILESCDTDIEEKLWARLPSYYAGEHFVRLIPFKDHINVEAAAVSGHKEELKSYKITPKGMLQISPEQDIPGGTLKRIFSETLNG